ncbi:MAG: RNase adapter RapZ [Clostridia bacterium]|nr:RNase adapter RapZ [Clostridia bacterium]
MQLTFVTGLSGSGKTQAARILEDIGFFCIDNMPPALIPKFAEMFFSASGKFEKVAIVVDIRVGDMFGRLLYELQCLKEKGYDYKFLFIDADDETLIKRYKESRRIHPVDSQKGLLDSISQERKQLEVLYNEADYIIDTSNMKLSELSQKIREIFLKDEDTGIKVNVMSFGFKYGMPLEADLVFDVRCFPNPFYVDDLKELTGNDKAVQDYVTGFPETQTFMKKLYEMMKFLLPLYIEEGKSNLTISIGCTGGKHRSVTMANQLGNMLMQDNYDVIINHRDIMKGRNV